MGTREQNIDVVMRYMEARRNQDLDLFDEVLAEGFEHYMMGQRETRAELLEGVRRDIERAAGRPSLPSTLTFDAVVADDERVALAYTATYLHPKLQKQIQYTGMLIAEVKNGKLTGGWGEMDRLGIQQQLQG